MVIDPTYDYAYDFSDGLARVCLPNKGCGYINTKGEWLIKPVTGDIHGGDYSSGLIKKIDKKTKKYGYINKNDEWVIQPQFSSAEPFVNGLAVVSTSSTGSNNSTYLRTSAKKALPFKQIINPQGKVLWKGYFHFAKLTYPGIILLAKADGFASTYKNTNNYAYYNRKFRKVYEPTCAQKIIQDLQTLKACKRKYIKRVWLTDVDKKIALKYLKKTNPILLKLSPKNDLKNVPDLIFSMTNLKRLDLNFQKIKQLPQKIANLKNLEELDLQHNQLSQLPEAIYQLKKLKKLNVANNQLKIKEIVRIKKKLPNVEITFSNGSHGFLSDVASNLNLIPYRKGNLWGYCDSSKKIIIKPQFQEVGFFKAKNNIVSAEGKINDKDIMIFQDGSYVENTRGMYVISLMGGSFQAPFVRYTTDSSFIFGKKHGFEYNSYTQQIRISPAYSFCHGVFSSKSGKEFYAVVTRKETGKAGIVDSKGNIVLPFEYKYLRLIDSEKQVLIAKKGRKYGLIKFKDKILYPFELDSLDEPAHGLMLAQKAGYYGYINPQGQIVVDFKYIEASSFGTFPATGPFAFVSKNAYYNFFINTKGVEFFEK